jgi:hypothetical protein
MRFGATSETSHISCILRPIDLSASAIMSTKATDYDSYRTLEEAIAALEDLYATGEVLPSAQPRVEHRTSKPRPYVIVIGKKGKSVVESC